MPDRIFFTGAPGSMWSGIAQELENGLGLNITDRTGGRAYEHNNFTGHKGNYFGRGMEFSADLERLFHSDIVEYIDSPWQSTDRTRIVKSHEWMYKIPFLKKNFPNDWIMMVYRPDMACYAWWHEAGGFNINYPSYKEYGNSEGMMAAIMDQNRKLLEVGYDYDVTWQPFTSAWVEENFGKEIQLKDRPKNILVSIIK